MIIQTNKSAEDDARYTTSFDERIKLFTRVDNHTGETWAWYAREKPKQIVHTAKNGVTVAKLQAAGNNVRVKHLRWALYLPSTTAYSRRQATSRAIVVPSTFRSDPMYAFLPKGGYTHVVIKHPSGKYICTSSECSEEDSFCYAAGVASALGRLTVLERGLLGVLE